MVLSMLDVPWYCDSVTVKTETFSWTWIIQWMQRCGTDFSIGYHLNCSHQVIHRYLKSSVIVSINVLVKFTFLTSSTNWPDKLSLSIKLFVFGRPVGVSLRLNLIPRECLLRTPNQFVLESLDVDSCRVMNAQFDLYTIMREVLCEVIVIPGSDAVSVTITWNSELSLSICWTLQIPLVILHFFPKHR